MLNPKPLCSQVEYDMVKAWDARKRKFYGDRYDFQKNMVRGEQGGGFKGWGGEEQDRST